jgi:pimeloyl-ACP methyl ester carboxylesterase
MARSRHITAPAVSSEAGGSRVTSCEAGDGEPVVFVHGMWGASFLYRKVLQHLAARGLCGIAFDLPGFVFAERPSAFDHTWTGLGEFAAGAVDALGVGDLISSSTT